MHVRARFAPVASQNISQIVLPVRGEEERLAGLYVHARTRRTHKRLCARNVVYEVFRIKRAWCYLNLCEQAGESDNRRGFIRVHDGFTIRSRAEYRGPSDVALRVKSIFVQRYVASLGHINRPCGPAGFSHDFYGL